MFTLDDIHKAYNTGMEAVVISIVNVMLLKKHSEILLTKTMRDENEFKQEVENLAKYFNADVFRSGD